MPASDSKSHALLFYYLRMTSILSIKPSGLLVIYRLRPTAISVAYHDVCFYTANVFYRNLIMPFVILATEYPVCLPESGKTCRLEVSYEGPWTSLPSLERVLSQPVW